MKQKKNSKAFYGANKNQRPMKTPLDIEMAKRKSKRQRLTYKKTF